MKIKNFMIYVIFIIIIFASFVIPTMLLLDKEIDFTVAVFEDNRKIDIEASQMYIVKMIQDINKMNAKNVYYKAKEEQVVTCKGDEFARENSEIAIELEKLADYNIINNLELTPDTVVEMSYIDRVFNNKNLEYYVKEVTLKIDGKTLKFTIEEKTGKILDIFFYNSQIINNKISKADLLLNYVKYLDLNIIDDWIYEDNVLKSSQSSMIIVSATNGEFSFIAINTMDSIKDAPEAIFEK